MTNDDKSPERRTIEKLRKRILNLEKHLRDRAEQVLKLEGEIMNLTSTFEAATRRWKDTERGMGAQIGGLLKRLEEVMGEENNQKEPNEPEDAHSSLQKELSELKRELRDHKANTAAHITPGVIERRLKVLFDRELAHRKVHPNAQSAIKAITFPQYPEGLPAGTKILLHVPGPDEPRVKVSSWEELQQEIDEVEGAERTSRNIIQPPLNPCSRCGSRMSHDNIALITSSIFVAPVLIQYSCPQCGKTTENGWPPHEYLLAAAAWNKENAEVSKLNPCSKCGNALPDLVRPGPNLTEWQVRCFQCGNHTIAFVGQGFTAMVWNEDNPKQEEDQG